MIIRYNIRNLLPYINWAYFYFAWSVKEATDEAVQLKADAMKMLKEFSGRYEAFGLFRLFDCVSEGDDVLIIHPADCPCCKMNPKVILAIPFLRQQTADEDGYCWCLSDFIRPRGGMLTDKIGVFATSVSAEMQTLYSDDPYKRMLVQTISDRLAEAAAERLHEQVRRELWGYAPGENLTIEDLQRERFQGIRPAVGYPCMPDVSLNFLIDKLLGMKEIGISLTEHGMMQPHASVSGFMISHPQSKYFSIGAVAYDQLNDYARRRGMAVEDIRKYLK